MDFLEACTEKISLVGTGVLDGPQTNGIVGVDVLDGPQTNGIVGVGALDDPQTKMTVERFIGRRERR